MSHEDENAARTTSATSARGTWAWRAKSAYSAVAHGAGRLLQAVHVLPSTPPPRTHRIRHWLVSLTKVHDSLAMAELDVPWWTYDAIDAVEAWIGAKDKPVRVFEWGSGASTLWLADRVGEIISVEHHHEFSQLIGPVVTAKPNVTFLEVSAPTSDAPRIGSHKTGSEHHEFFDYVHAIDEQTGSFDLVVIDGRAREACLRVAIDRLEPDGLIVFDNTHRARYQEAIAASGMAEQVLRGLTPTLPYPDRTSLLTRRPSQT